MVTLKADFEDGFIKAKIFILAVLLCVPAGILIISFAKQEPKYQGKTAAVWLGNLKPLKKTPELDALENMGQKAVPTLEAALHSPRPNDRFKATWVAGQLGPNAKEMVPALIDAMGDDNRSVRYYAINSVESIDPFRADLIPVLVKSLGDTNRSVSAAAAKLLNKIEMERKEKQMDPPFTNEFDYDMAFLRSRASNVQLMGIDRLYMLPDPSKKDAIIAVLKSFGTNDNLSTYAHAQMGLRYLGAAVEAAGTNQTNFAMP